MVVGEPLEVAPCGDPRRSEGARHFRGGQPVGAVTDRPADRVLGLRRRALLRRPTGVARAQLGERPVDVALTDRVGVAGDNAAMESFFALLQKNVLNRTAGRTRGELRTAIITWIERTYHRRRRQARLGRLTPIEYKTIMNSTA